MGGFSGGKTDGGSHGALADAGPSLGGQELGSIEVAAVTASAAPKLATIASKPMQAFTQFVSASDLPTDSLFGQQWNLRNTGQSGGVAGVDIDVTPVWKLGITGKGVAVGVFDTAMDINHVDLAQNIDMSKRVVLANGTYVDPSKISASGDQHATSVAGIIAAANNGIGAVGVAYDASITPIDILGPGSTLNSYNWYALWNQKNFDVTNNSWGFSGSYVTGQLNASSQYWVLNSFKTGADLGRNGLGTIETLAAGNYRQINLSTETNGATMDRHAIVVGAVDDHGYVTYYSNPGASLSLVAPSGGSIGGITTDDITGTLGYSKGDYATGFSGTSAATPQIAGVAALMLQANPLLGWRDVQEILAITARHIGSDINAGVAGYEKDAWSFNHALNWNGGGMHFSNDYGFGLVDAFSAVLLAKSWSLVYSTAHTSANELLTQASVSGSWDVGHATTNTISFNITSHVAVEEMVLDLTNLKHNGANHLTIDLTSPTGTTSQLLVNNGASGAQITAGWELMSREFRGEDSYGTWTLKISDNTATDVGSLSSATLKAYGAATVDNSVFFFTDEFALYGSDPARAVLNYTAGVAIIDAAPVTGAMTLNLLTGQGMIDGQALTITAATKVQMVITGNGDSIVIGNNLGDRIVGGLGNDILTGGTGLDTLDGGAGSNTLTGGNGADKFILHTLGLDTIVDFQAGTDRLVLSAVEFGGNIKTSGINSADFVVGAAASTHVAGGGIVYDTASATVWWDKDGASALVQLAKITNNIAIGAGDFLMA
jgi:subtilisin family serine protease/subtilisin-like proprotein convertase family protein